MGANLSNFSGVMPAKPVPAKAGSGHPVTPWRCDSRPERCVSRRPAMTGSSAFADDDNRASLK